MAETSKKPALGLRASARLTPALIVVVALLAAACSGDETSSGSPTDDPAAAAAQALEDAGATSTTTTVPVTNTTQRTEPLDPTAVPGAIINQYTLGLGDCFDQLRDIQNGLPVTITTKLGCNTPHEFEVFHQLTFPVGFPAIFPGEKVMTEFALRSCYVEFEGWVGTQYEVSALEIEVLTPTRENFEDDVARYRGIHCFAHRSDGDPLDGPTRLSEL